MILPKDAPPEERPSLRRIPLRGTRNLRDLGGYRTADGRALRWGVLYRSDALALAGRKAADTLRRMGLAVIIDFRTEAERAAAPDRIPPGCSARLVRLPVFDGPNSVDKVVRRRLEEGSLGEADPAALFREAYGQLPIEHLGQYRAFVREVLEAGGRPILFHCVAGKDRTGFAAALVLRLLSVPAETIVGDYLLSRRYQVRISWTKRLLFALRYGRKAYGALARMLTIEPGFLEAAFARIDSVYGSFDAFAARGLGLGPADLERLADALLEPRGSPAGGAGPDQARGSGHGDARPGGKA